MQMLIIKFAKVRPDAIIPTKERGNAGYDIYANFEGDRFIIEPNTTKLVPTGIASSLDYDYYFQIEERGSTGSRGMKKSAGVIDPNYTGEWFIAITNCNNKPIIISKEPISNDDCIVYPYDKAIAQAVLHRNHIACIEEIPYEELKAIPSDRGDGKLGSSGK